MSGSTNCRRRPTTFLGVGLLVAALALSGPLAWAHEETAEEVEAFLHGLEDAGDITHSQHTTIDNLFFSGKTEQLHHWLHAQETAGQIPAETMIYLLTLLDLEHPEAAFGPAPANYTGNGNVTLLGHLNPQPPNPYFGDNSSGQLYNGVWGYTVGSREYALQTNSGGLHVLDVTDPANAFRVQFLSMGGGRIWRDVDVHEDVPTGTTYAYVSAQSGGNLWVVNLQALSGGAPHGVDSNPIPSADFVDRGRTNYGHTVSVNDGLLFTNSANSGSTLGCQIFDLNQDPWNPPLIASWSGSQRDCHDSFSRTNVPGSGGKDLLYSADGFTTRYRILDISGVRTGGTPTLVGESAVSTGIYAHSNWLTEDSQYLYAFEESNVHDIAVYDMSDPAAPTLVTTFQYSGDATASSIIHNCQIRGNFLLAGYYEAGFRVFDISNPANAVEVGKWETWRDPDGDGTFNEAITGDFNGAWNLYSFLPSGNVLVSDMKTGTYVFRVDPVPLPATPGALQATAGDAKVDLDWTASSGATGYSVHRGTASGGPYTTVATHVAGTSFTDNGLTNGTTYFYVVSATNATGESVDSNEASATPADQPGCDVEVDFDDGGAAGWTNSGASTCTTGSFVVATPSEQTNGGVVTQVGGDHTSGTGNAFFSATNTSAGANDVDGGTCTVESPVYPIAEPSDVSIWYFHGQRDAGDDAGDFFLLEISTDGGAGYSPMVSIGDVTLNAAWTEATAAVPAGSNVTFRVQVADGSGGGDLVEGGVDDLTICPNAPSCVVDADCDDGLFCNGAETCDAAAGCQAGSDPCGAFGCDEVGDVCLECNVDADCDDAAFCNGAETCNAGSCQAGSDPCPGQSCDEAGDVCVAGGSCTHSADFESGAGGWTNGADTCSTGAFVVGVPDATAWQVGGGNPGGAFFTAPNPGGIGADDVDGGTCEALSPAVDCAGQAAAQVSLDYFHGQRDAADDAGDGFTIEVLNDGVVVDTMVAVGDVTTNPAWTNVSATVTNPGNVQVRVRATDGAGGGDIIEGGIDNVSIQAAAPPPPCTVDDDFESGAPGWTNDPASTCTTGDYVVGDPTNPGGGVQIVGSHSGVNSLFTGVNTGAGTADVDGGNCILASPSWAVAEASTLSVWYWHGQRDAADDAGDFFLLEVSVDGGSSWSALASIGDTATTAAWTNATAPMAAGSNVEFRVQCSDGAATGDLVECGIDDVSICSQ